MQLIYSKKKNQQCKYGPTRVLTRYNQRHYNIPQKIVCSVNPTKQKPTQSQQIRH